MANLTAQQEPESAEESDALRQELSQIADTLCETLVNRFDIRVLVESDVEELQKLAIMINFLLERARRTVSDLEHARSSLETVVEERTRQLNLVLEGSNDGVWIWDLERGRIQLSARWLHMVGVDEPAGHFDPEAWFDRVHPRDIDELWEALRDHMRFRNPFVECEYRLRHEDGTYRWMLCRGICERDDIGRPISVAGTQTDLTERRNLDPVTRLPNETFFRERTTDLIDEGRAFNAAVIGIEKMSTLHDGLGIDAIDAIRQSTAERIAQSLPGNAFVARLGGDYYGVLCFEDAVSGSSAELGDHLVRLFDGAVEITEPVHKRIWLGASVGIVGIAGEQNLSSDEIIAAGWTAMRRARTGGGNRYEVFRDELRRLGMARMQTEQDVRDALARGDIVPFFQPILATQTRQVRGFEALVRIRREGGDPISPADFLPVAQASHLIVDIGNVVLEESLRQFAAWHADGEVPEDAFISINVDAKQFGADLAGRVEAALRKVRVPPRCLKLEVTETAIMTDFDSSVAICDRLRDQGVRVAIDDFGTGYSSLSYLRRLPVDVIKIDRSFVTTIHNAREKRAIVQTILHLAEALGLDVIAEGVESEKEHAVLRELGVHLAQGYFFGRPLSAEETITSIKSSDQNWLKSEGRTR